LLPVPNIRWKTISIDFVIELPESIEFDIVIIVIVRVCGQTLD